MKLTASTFLLLMILVSSAWSDQYLLTMEWEKDSIGLVSSERVPGQAKIPKDGRVMSEIYCQGQDGKGQGIFCAEVQISKSLYYDNPSEDGTLKGGKISLEKGVFTLKVPADKDLKRLALFKSEANTRKTLHLQSGDFSVPKGKGITSFDLDNAQPPKRKVNTAQVNKILDNGPDDNRLVWVFLGDGYTSSEQAKFATDVQAAMNYIVTQEPWGEYQNYMNAYTVEVVSQESGADHPSRGVYRNTALDATYDYLGVTRLVVCDSAKVYAAASVVPAYDSIFVVVNDSEYGGSGGSFAVFSTHPSGIDVAVHEYGHSFPGLGDEYDDPYILSGDPEPNIEMSATLPDIKWNLWILPGTPIPTPENSGYATVVGLFEGAKYHPTGYYRPKLNCKMRSLGVPFCEVCQEAHIAGSYSNSLYKMLHLIEGRVPSADSLELSGPPSASFIFQVDTLQTTSSTVKCHWFLNSNELIGMTDSQISLYGAQFSEGNNSLSVTVEDETTRVKNDPYNYRRGESSWSISFQPTSSVNLWKAY